MTTPTITPIDATGLLWSLALLLADHPDADRHQLARDIGGLFEGILGEGPDRAVVADVVETSTNDTPPTAAATGPSRFLLEHPKRLGSVSTQDLPPPILPPSLARRGVVAGRPVTVCCGG